MLVSVLPVPFADAARQEQYEAVRAALAAEADAPATVLLGHLAAFTPVAADALIVRPGGLALVMLVPQGGHLTIPALAYGAWYLDGQPLPSRAETDNPFAYSRQQLPLALAWLREQLGLAALPASLGLALFEAPLTVGPEVDGHLRTHAAHGFRVVSEAAQVPTCLHALPRMGALADDELLDWGHYLATEPYAAPQPGFPESSGALLKQKLRQLWRWLGAEDIPADPPYGGPAPIDFALRDQQEQARLEQLRQELQAELHQQRAEAARRETAREQELALLRQQLAQASRPAAARQAEHQAQAALAEALRTTRAELAARTQALDERIEHLGQLIRALQLPPARPPVGPLAPPAQAVARPAAPAPRPATRSYRRLRQAERWGLLLLAVAILGTGTVAVLRALRPVVARSLVQRAGRGSGGAPPAESAVPAPVIRYDTLANVPGAPPDTAATTTAAAGPPPAAPGVVAARADTARAVAAPAPAPTPAAPDTATASPQP